GPVMPNGRDQHILPNREWQGRLICVYVGGVSVDASGAGWLHEYANLHVASRRQRHWQWPKVAYKCVVVEGGRCDGPYRGVRREGRTDCLIPDRGGLAAL